MTARRPVVLAPAAALVLSLSPSLPAQGLAYHDLHALPGIAGELLLAAPLFGASCVRVEQGGTLVHLSSTGDFDRDTVVPIASATKTLSAAVLLSLADDGVLSLDDRVSQYLPEWDVGLKRFITLRQCFTHTSGMVTDSPLLNDDTVTLRQAAAQLVQEPLQAAPGTRFAYGGVSMQVAGAACEVASGQAWSALFQQRIAGPLGLTATDYEAFGPTPNPRIGGGVRSNARDYGRFVAMLQNGGVHQGAAVLGAVSVDEMLRDQTSGVPILSTPHPDEAPYGIGIWLERQGAGGETLLAVGVGAFGFAGWVDRAHGSSGVFSVRYLNQQTFPYVRRMWQAIDDAMLPHGVACAGSASPACVRDAWLNGSRQPVAGTPDFAVLCARAPANAPGAVAVAPGVTGGLPFADLQVYLTPGFAVTAAVVADAHGRARIPAPLSAGLGGQTFAMQAVWFGGQPCTQLGLSLSHALVVTVQ